MAERDENGLSQLPPGGVPAERPAPPAGAGPLSADGRYWWDGYQWVPAMSGDGRWRWDGREWRGGDQTWWSGYPRQPQVPLGGMVVAPKSPAVSLIVSFFLPGVGSMVNGDVGIGVVILAIFLVGIPLSFLIIGIPMILGAWIWGMVDAYTGARRWNARHGIIS
jgi:TM2 domain-containing membrane protein YozV